MTRPFLITVLLLLASGGSFAAPTITCHCFRDRDYDPSRPAAADSYILATAQNSLISAAFGVDKGRLVKARMSGTPAEDLWIAHWVASNAQADAGRLLAVKGENAAWQTALAAAGVDPARLGSAFAQRLSAGAGDAALAAEAADDVLRNRLRAPPATVTEVRAQGATTNEAILACLLGPRVRVSPVTLYAEVKGGRKTWGSVLRDLGLAPKDVDATIRNSLR